MPAASTPSKPLIQVQVLALGLYSQRSLRRSSPLAPVESKPLPPNSHKLPVASTQESAEKRAPGVLPAEAVPLVPYTPNALIESEPLTQVQVRALGLNFHRSLKYAALSWLGPDPPKSQRLPAASVHDVAQLRAPGKLLADCVPCVP